MPEDTTAVEEQAKPRKLGGSLGKILLVVLLALVSSASGGVVSFFLISRTMIPATAAPAEKEKDEAEKLAEIFENGAVLPLDPFVVNLTDQQAPRYLRIKISLMIDDKTKLAHVVDNQALQQKVRDVILQSLTAKSSQDLINEEGKNKLRHEIQEKVAVYFREPKLVDVMFTEFVIQL